MALQPTMKKKPKAKGFGATMKPKSVASRVNEITATDSATMRAARTRAQQQANARGLGNSSIAIGAGELAAIQSALPMASQDSSEENSRELSRMGFRQNLALQDDAQEYGTSEREAAQAFTFTQNELDRGLTREQAQAERDFRKSERLGEQEFTSGESGKERAFRREERESAQDFQFTQNELDRGLTREQAQAEREFRREERESAEDFQFTQAELDRGLTREEAQNEREFRTSERLGAQGFSAAENRLDRGLTTSEREASEAFRSSERREDEAFRAAEAERVRGFATSERLAGESFAADQARQDRAQQLTVIAEQANFDADSAEARREFDAMIAEWNIDASEQENAAQYVANASATYANQYSAVLSNPELNPEARQQQVGLLRAQNEKRLNLGEQIFGVKLDFGAAPSANTATASGGGLPGPGEPGYVQGRAPGEQYPGATAAERKANREADREGRIAARRAANAGAG